MIARDEASFSKGVRFPISIQPVYPGHMTMEHMNKPTRAVPVRYLSAEIVVSTHILTQVFLDAA